MGIRSDVKEKLGDFVIPFIHKNHEQNYEHLLIDSSGDVWFSESTDSTYYGPYLSLGKAGTGSVHCNCDWCQGPDAVEGVDDIEIESDEVDHIMDRFYEKLDEQSFGFFNDEERNEEEI